MKLQEWEEIAKVLLAAYPQAAIPVETLAVYANELQDLQASSVMFGVKLAMRECAFFPTIAEIRTRAESEEGRFRRELEDHFAKLPANHSAPEDPERRKRINEEGMKQLREALADSKGPLANDLGQVAG